MSARLLTTALLLAVALAAQQSAAPERPKPEGDDQRGYTDTPQLPGQRWKVHDAERPRPRKVAPGPVTSAPPPADAVVLFDGGDLSKWITMARGGKVLEPQWKVENGYIEIVPRRGRLVTKDKFGDCQLSRRMDDPERD